MRDVDCLCGCSGKLADWEKENVYELFRGKETHSMQDEYLRGCTVITGEKRLRNGNVQLIFQHFLRFERKTVNVCQKFFCGIHGIERSRLRGKVLRQGAEIIDQRGKHPNHRVVPDDVKQSMRIFMAALPASPSHYTLKESPNRLYMDPIWTVAALHRRFLEEFPGISSDNAKLPIFRQVFNTEFNIKFGHPKKDICSTCELFLTELKNIKITRPLNVELSQQKKAELVQHLETANIFYSDYSAAKGFGEEHFALCFDYQKNIPLPSTQVNKEFYMSQLWIFNFAIKNLRTGEAKMYVYSEHYASKGSNEIVSCLLWYVQHFVPRACKTLHVFCDDPTGQNKNRFVFGALQMLANSRFERVYMTFPVPGHSRMPIDGDFGRIGQVLKKTQRLSFPSDVVDVILRAQPERPFDIIYVNHALINDMRSDGRPIVVIKDYKTSLLPLFPPLQQATLQLQKIREILFCAGSKPLTNFTERFAYPQRELHLFMINVTPVDVEAKMVAAKPAYDAFLPIAPAKLKNVEKLIKYVARRPHEIFYNTLYTMVGAKKRYLVVDQ